jgi:hypothetical protein
VNNLKGKNHSIIFIVILAIIFFIFNGHKAIAIQNCNVSNNLLTQTQAEQTALQLINNHRSQNGLSPLTWSTSLKRAAAWMSNDMSVNNSFSHTDSLGRNPGQRITECGYVWTKYGENIYPNSNDPQKAFDAWKNSPPHNKNMLDANFKEVGIAEVNGFWTLDLGTSNQSGEISPTNAQTNPTINPSITPSPSPTGTPFPTPTPSIILNPTDTKINLSVRFKGVGPDGNKSPKRLSRQVSLGIYDLENKLVLTGNGFLKYNGKGAFEGTVHLGQLADATYYVKLASERTLVSLVVPEFQSIKYDSPNTLPTTELINGDLNLDNSVDIKDFNIVLPCFQRRICPIKDIIDFNDDGKSDVIDYNLFLSSFRNFEGD